MQADQLHIEEKPFEAALKELAHGWQSTHLASVEPSRLFAQVMERLSALDLVAQSGPRRISDLTPLECPALIIAANGQTIILRDLLPDGSWQIIDAENWTLRDQVSFMDLVPHQIFTLVPANSQAHNDLHASWSPRSMMTTFLWQSRRHLAFAMLAAFIGQLMMLAVPLFTMAVYDRVVPHLAVETLWALAIGTALALALDAVVKISKQSLLEAVSERATKRLQASLFDRLLRIPYLERPTSGGMLARSFADFDQLCHAGPQLTVALFVDLPCFFLILLLIASLGGPVAFVPLAGAILLAGLHLIARPIAVSRHGKAHVQGHLRSQMLIETTTVLPWLKLCDATGNWRSRWERLVETFLTLTGDASRIDRAVQHIGSMLVQWVTVGVLVVGVYRIGVGAMTVGALVACSLLVGRAIAPMIGHIATLQRALRSYQQLNDLEHLWQTPPEMAGDQSINKQLGTAKGALAVRYASFTYPGSHAPGLDDISLTIPAGQHVAIIGRNGSGKSTLLKMLVRLFDPNSGGVLLDGHDLRQYSPEFIRREIALAPQEPWLIDGTIRDNLLLGLELPDQTEFENIARITGLSEMVAETPNGLGQAVGNQGERLSAGQRTSILLARALLAKSAVVLLDEPTANLDQAREHQLMAELKHFLRKKTMIMTTHRLACLAVVDRVLCLERGRIVLDKPRDEALSILRSKPNLSGVQPPKSVVR